MGRRPGLARADRPRNGAFEALARRAEHDADALDALVFAYEALPTEDRRRFARAVAGTASASVPALTALLCVEEDRGLRVELAGRIHRSGLPERGGTLRLHTTGGEARLFCGQSREALFVAWNQNDISELEVETGVDVRLLAKSAIPIEQVIDAIAPRLWRHLRNGRPVPLGAARFAAFFGASFGSG